MPTVDSAGTSIYWELDGDGEPVVLVMGLGADAHAWEFQRADFAARHQVLVVDNRGVGRSGKPPGPYTMAQLAGDVVAAMDAAGVARAHLVGISMGGMIVQELALAHPERTGAVVLAATSAKPGEEARATSQEGAQKISHGSSLEMLVSGQIDLSNIQPAMMLEFLLPMVFSSKFRESHRDWLRDFHKRSLTYGFSMPAFLGQMQAVLAHDATARLPTLARPTLVVTGTRDRLVQPHHSDELARLIPGARLHKFEGGTHGMNFEIPEQFNRVVLDFLAEHPLSSPGA